MTIDDVKSGKDIIMILQQFAISQVELAKLLDVSPQLVHLMSTNKAPISSKTLRRIDEKIMTAFNSGKDPFYEIKLERPWRKVRYGKG